MDPVGLYPPTIWKGEIQKEEQNKDERTSTRQLVASTRPGQLSLSLKRRFTKAEQAVLLMGEHAVGGTPSHQRRKWRFVAGAGRPRDAAWQGTCWGGACLYSICLKRNRVVKHVLLACCDAHFYARNVIERPGIACWLVVT
jgi:hypothetical protein